MGRGGGGVMCGGGCQGCSKCFSEVLSLPKQVVVRGVQTAITSVAQVMYLNWRVPIDMSGVPMDTKHICVMGFP